MQLGELSFEIGLGVLPFAPRVDLQCVDSSGQHMALGGERRKGLLGRCSASRADRVGRGDSPLESFQLGVETDEGRSSGSLERPESLLRPFFGFIGLDCSVLDFLHYLAASPLCWGRGLFDAPSVVTRKTQTEENQRYRRTRAGVCTVHHTPVIAIRVPLAFLNLLLKSTCCTRRIPVWGKPR